MSFFRTTYFYVFRRADSGCNRDKLGLIVKEIMCINERCKANLIVTYELNLGLGIAPYPRIKCSKCGDEFEILPLPGPILNVSVTD